MNEGELIRKIDALTAAVAELAKANRPAVFRIPHGVSHKAKEQFKADIERLIPQSALVTGDVEFVSPYGYRIETEFNGQKVAYEAPTREGLFALIRESNSPFVVEKE